MSDQERRRLRVLQDGAALSGAAPAEGAAPEGVDRRRFLTLAMASLALAKVTGCTRQPPEQIVPHVRQPEDAPPGVARYYATSMVQKGYAAGLLVRSEMGRPIKVEGNPDHPSSLGAADAFAQASVMSLYDPDRAQVISHLGRITTWSHFVADLTRAVDQERGRRGAGIRVLTETVSSPAFGAEMDAFLRDFPEAKWARWEPAGRHHTKAGARLAFGAPLETRYDLTAADVVLTLESDLLAAGPGSLRYAHDFASRRGAGQRTSREPPPIGSALDPGRLYSIESAPTLTSTVADNRMRLRPSEVAAFVSVLAAELSVFRDGAIDVAPEIARWASVIARDLRAHRGRGLVACGEPAPPAIHALAAVMNDALGNVGHTVTYSDPVEIDPVDHLISLRALADDMRAGRVSLLVVLGANPVYTAPADIDFTGAMQRVAMRVQLSLLADETSAYCHYHVPEAHFLESWGDARAHDGTTSLLQPLLEPLYAGKSALEVLAALRGHEVPSGLDLVRARFREGATDADPAWREALREGLLRDTAFPSLRADIAVDAAQKASLDIASAARDRGGYELSIRPDPTVDDGRFSNNGWLQELPKPHTKLTWDNAAIIDPRTAAELGVQTGDVLELAREGRSVTAAALVLRGQPEATVTVHLGYGRTAGGETARGAGFDAYRLRTSMSLWHGPGLVIRRTGERASLATTQGQFQLEGRTPVRTLTVEEARTRPEEAREEHPGGGDPYGHVSLYPGWDYPGRQWGMSIDLGACTGCSACVVACVAENNIPVVGKAQVENGRVMHWLRIDRYEVGAGDDPLALHQPMMCVHCENAPCEYVCPVGATTHSVEGLNEMTYNRCVGTRYCSNNCPYKVRRFNFFEYHEHEGIARLQRNPDVTVRSRGVMEKCSYCVQRITHGRIAAEREGRSVRDGEVVTACQQACPTGAIVFGDIHDPEALVAARKADPRMYGVLAELNTRPRTTYLARVRNPHPELEEHG